MVSHINHGIVHTVMPYSRTFLTLRLLIICFYLHWVMTQLYLGVSNNLTHIFSDMLSRKSVITVGNQIRDISCLPIPCERQREKGAGQELCQWTVQRLFHLFWKLNMLYFVIYWPCFQRTVYISNRHVYFLLKNESTFSLHSGPIGTNTYPKF